MKTPARHPTTVYLDPRIAKAAKVMAAVSDRSLSDLVNDALAAQLRQDDDDLRLMRAREKQPSRSYEDVLKDLKRDGLI
jgi:hypothetical protein